MIYRLCKNCEHLHISEAAYACGIIGRDVNNLFLPKLYNQAPLTQSNEERIEQALKNSEYVGALGKSIIAVKITDDELNTVAHKKPNFRPPTSCPYILEHEVTSAQ